MSYKEFYNYLKEFEEYSFSKNKDKRNIMAGAMQTDTGGVIDYGNSLRRLRHELLDCFVFKISKPLFTLLYLTDNDDLQYNPEEHKLPYDKIFIDSEIVYENYKIKGLIIQKDKTPDNKDSIYCNFLIYNEQDGGIDSYIPVIDIFKKDSLNDCNYGKLDVRVTLNDELRNNLRCFILNFLNFLNNPTIEIIQSENKDSYGGLSGKISKGSKEIVLTGKLKIYLDKISEQIKDVTLMRKAHWVRGHWRTFHSEKFVNKRGTKTWIYPFIQGIGIVEKKDYVLKNEHSANQSTKESLKDISPKIEKEKQTI